MVGEQRAGASSPPSLGRESDAEDFGLVRGAAREDEAVRLAAAPDEQPVGEGAALGQKALELQGAPSAREGAAVDRGEAGGVARVQRRDPHRAWRAR